MQQMRRILFLSLLIGGISGTDKSEVRGQMTEDKCFTYMKICNKLFYFFVALIGYGNIMEDE